MKQQQESATMTAPAQSPVYQSCAQLPLRRFIAAYVHGNLSAIVRKGRSATRQQIAEAWSAIGYEWADLMATTESRAFLSEKQEAAMLSSRIERVYANVQAITAMQTLRHDVGEEPWKESLAKVAGLLLDMGFVGTFPHDNDEALQADLNRVLTIIKADELRLREITSPEDAKKGKAVTAVWFDEVLIEVSKMMGFRLSVAEMKTAEFAGYFQRLRMHHKAQTKNVKGHGSK